MTVGFGNSITTKGRPLANLAHLERSIVRVKSENNCLAHALIIAIAKIMYGPNYRSYSDGRKIGPVDQSLLELTSINVDRGGCLREINKFQEYFK